MPPAWPFRTRSFFWSAAVDLLDLSEVPRSQQADYRSWLRRFAKWLYGISHIEISYSIDYEAVDIRKLSPGICTAATKTGQSAPGPISDVQSNPPPHAGRSIGVRCVSRLLARNPLHFCLQASIGGLASSRGRRVIMKRADVLKEYCAELEIRLYEAASKAKMLMRYADNEDVDSAIATCLDIEPLIREANQILQVAVFTSRRRE
jgi:hypothetical protein